MDGEESSLARLAAWGGLAVLTFALSATVLLDRAARPPLLPPAVEESTRQRCLRSLDHQITDALARGAADDDEELRQLQTLRQRIDTLPARQLAAGP
jgi:hypothetical protein